MSHPKNWLDSTCTNPAVAVAIDPTSIAGSAGRASRVVKIPRSGTRSKLTATNGHVASVAAAEMTNAEEATLEPSQNHARRQVAADSARLAAHPDIRA